MPTPTETITPQDAPAGSPRASGATTAPLPQVRGPLSEAVCTLLRGGHPGPVDPAGADPYGDDLQLALYCCYELHYRGFEGVDDVREWDLAVLGLRRDLERAFLGALRADVEPGSDVTAAVDALLVEPVGPAAETGVSHHLSRDGQRWQLREYIPHRSIYHLKEADPQAWVIPRLSGAVVFGIRASTLLGDRLDTLLMDRWRTGRSSLRRPLTDGPGR